MDAQREEGILECSWNAVVVQQFVQGGQPMEAARVLLDNQIETVSISTGSMK
ncbi:unnamed protein product, partial [Nesidiocoris tenuis]